MRHSLLLLVCTLAWIVAGDDASNPQIPGPRDDVICEYFDEKTCDPASSPDCKHEIVCDKPTTGQGRSCYTVWNNLTQKGAKAPTIKILLKGCWEYQKGQSECEQQRCVHREEHKLGDVNPMFCCCVGPLCNAQPFYKPNSSALHSSDPAKTTLPPPSDQSLMAVLYVFVPICFLALIIFLSYWIYRKHRITKPAGPGQSQDVYANGHLKLPESGPHLPVQLLEVVAHGRYGQVWKAQMSEKFVAVKVFPPQDADSWMQEQDIYNVGGLRNQPNILHFMAAEVHGCGMDAEYWLITKYHPLGSLTEHLKGNTFSLSQTLNLGASMLRGLAYLHEELVGRDDDIRKPTIVHRDFKSRNVLLNNDLTACIADFGLALKCEHGRTPEETHGQVGTRRYMSPEVLEGATEFSAFAFRQIDVYAAALVFWEIVSRTRISDKPPNEYKLPFEEELGLHPSLAEMQQLVNTNKTRPQFEPEWRRDQKVDVLCSTIEEMWDTEPEARITAGCALERVLAMQGPPDSVHFQHQLNLPLEGLADEQPECSPLICAQPAPRVETV